MKKSLKKPMAALSAAVITFCGVSGIFPAAAVDETPEGIKYTYDIAGVDENGDPIEFEPADGTKLENFDVTYSKSSSLRIPAGSFYREGYTFRGWTDDGIHGYIGGDRYFPEEGAEEVNFKGMWTRDDDELLTIHYDITYKGEPVDKSLIPFIYKDKYARPGMIYTPVDNKIKLETATSKGNIYEGALIEGGRRIVMPDHPITIQVRFLSIVNFTYTAGDVDRVNGNPSYTFQRNEESRTELADADRLSRSGFTLGGWHSSYDDQIYKTGQTITVPGEDVIYTAVWIPKTYQIIFDPGSSGEFIKVPGTTDTTIQCPEVNTTVDGKKFGGWKDENGKIYQPGDDYFVYGVLPGLGIKFDAIWLDPDEAIPTNPTKPQAEMYGDVNCDGKVTIADSAAVLLYLCNSDRNPLSGAQLLNADCHHPGDGVTILDAAAIQKYLAGIVALPEN